MLVKIHDAYRKIIAICDSGLIGKKFEEGNRQLDLTGGFFEGDEKTQEEVKEIIEFGKNEDATFNIVGKEACRLCKEAELIKDEGIIEIGGVHVALVLG